MQSELKTKGLHYIDLYGKELFIFKAKNGNVNFTLIHGEIIESTERHEFRNITLSINENSKEVFNFVKEIYNYSSNKLIISENPIRDGRNFMILEKINEEYFIIINHDLANEFRNPFETKVEVSNKFISDLYEKNIQNERVLKKRLLH